eukprot:1596349-Prymnesium_polylepis.2
MPHSLQRGSSFKPAGDGDRPTLQRSRVYETAIELLCSASRRARHALAPTAPQQRCPPPRRSVCCERWHSPTSWRRGDAAVVGIRGAAARALLAAIKAEVARGRLAVLEVVADEVGFIYLSYQEYLAGDAMRLLVQRGRDELVAASGRGALGGLGAWLGTCAGEVWWSQALLMGLEGLAYDKGAEAAALDALSADAPATAALRVGGEAELGYKPGGTQPACAGKAYRSVCASSPEALGRIVERRCGASVAGWSAWS